MEFFIIIKIHSFIFYVDYWEIAPDFLICCTPIYTCENGINRTAYLIPLPWQEGTPDLFPTGIVL